MTRDDDPSIEIVDVTAHSGMGQYAQHSREAAWLCTLDAATAPPAERAALLRNARMHRDVAQMYDEANRTMAEVEAAVAGEEVA